MAVELGALPGLDRKLDALLAGEYNLQKGVKEQILFLKHELERMKAVLQHISYTPADQLPIQDKIWARNVRELSYDIEDSIDVFMVRVEGSEPAKFHGTKRFIDKALKSLMQPKIRRKIATDIREIKSRVQEVHERHNRYKIDTDVPKPITVDPRLVTLYQNTTNLVGIQEAIDELTKMLMEGNEVSKQQAKIVSIVGTGGLGKTTLANEVYQRLRAHFDCSAFVSVSQTPDMDKLFKNMFYQLSEYNITASIDVIGELRKFLLKKRYFIVFDDLWDISVWEYIASAFMDSNNGSRIIVTTRISQVAAEIGEVYMMRPLSYINSKKLLYTRIFSDEDACPDDDGLAKVTEEIIKKCGGLPIAINSVASLLANKPIKDWPYVFTTVGFVHRENKSIDDMMRILSLSYYALPYHLRTCLLYLSVYPEDHVIKKNKLIWTWIAEGFVHGEAGTELYRLGESYFRDLVNSSMILPVKIEGTDQVYGCRVHDMILDFIRSMSYDQNFVFVLDEERQIFASDNIRRLAIQNRKEEQSLEVNMYLARLRSLNATRCPMYMISPLHAFNLLRVLDLESCGSMEGYHLKHLGKLLHLRFFGLRNTFVREFPEEIGHLKFLQTLELEGSCVEELPESMGELTELMHLNADWTTRVPDWIGKLTSLRQLAIYPGGSDENSTRWFVKELRKLGELRVLRFLIKAQDVGQLRDLVESLTNLEKIEVIHFDYYGVLLNTSGVLMERTDFSLSKTLCFLELRWLEFSRRPSWINPQDLPNLHHLWLMVFDVENQDLEILGEFPELRHLHLLILNTERGGIITCGSGAFQNLKFFSVTKPLQFLLGAMPRLEVLDFHFNVRLLKDTIHNFGFDFGLGNLPSLRQVIIQINCLGAFLEVGNAQAAVSDAIDSHPNSPTLEISLFGKPMKTLDADLTQKLEKFQTDEPRDALLRMLSMADNDAYNKKMKILSVIRSEGLGKTTLAQEVFDKLSPQFDCRAFVQVGQNADLRKVFTDILIGLDKKKYENFPTTVLDLMELIGLLRKSLINKRFFVVVDDLWDLKAWDIIKCALIENRNGSVVLTTSCNTEVTEYIGGSLQLAPLSKTESKNFFCRKLFGSEDKCPPELESICEKLIETCDGILSKIIDAVKQLESVPLTVRDWQAVYGGRKISYPGLSDHQKSCILYFSMFQKGHEISAERLVWQWIAEGFVRTTEEQTLQEVGESYLNQLIMEKMIEAVEVDADGKALSCRVHDFVHDIVIKMSTEDNLVAILNGATDSDLTDTIHHRLSIMGNTEVHSLPKSWLSRVKSLAVYGDSMPPLSDFRELGVLDLGGSLQNDHLKGIHSSHSLRYLVIGSKCITCIPKEFMKLTNLQTLDLRASGLSELPKKVFRLENLERLCVNSHMKIPDGIGKMSALQELGDINISKPELLKELRKLSKLRVLRIAIWAWDDESLKSSGQQLWDNLCSLVKSAQNIRSLSILTCCSLEFMEGSGETWVPRTLQKLEIRYGTFYNKLPSWFGSLPNISSLTIEVCKLSQHIIDTLGDLSTLRSLFLTSKQIPEGYFFIDGSDRFKNLESLKFASNAMAQNMLAPRKATQQLKRLTIVFQASRTKDINEDFSFGLENLCSLELVRVEIFCFNASQHMVHKAEAAIQEAISRDPNSHPSLEILKLHKKSMIEEEDLR